MPEEKIIGMGADGVSDMTLHEPEFPDIHVKLSGTDGNAFAILGKVIAALKAGNADAHDVDAFADEATAGDYNHLLVTCMKWVDVS